jgi:hypothetical protein
MRVKNTEYRRQMKAVAALLLFTSLMTLVLLSLTFSEAHAFEIIRVVPAPESNIQDPRPTLYVYYSGDENENIDISRIKLKLNGMDITWKCLTMPNCISCTTSYDFQEGKNTILFTYEGSPPIKYEWSFVIGSKAKETGSLSHNAKEALEEGDILEVELNTSPGGKATFDIGAFKKHIEMKEISPGIYKGSYVVQRFDNAKDQEIIANLVLSKGETRVFTCPSRVSIKAIFFKVKILSPTPDATVDNYFDIIGRTRPNTKVSIAPTLNFHGGIGTTNPQNSGAIEVMSDEKGFFKVHFGFPIKVSGMNYTFYVTAVDDEENRSFPMTFHVKVK